MGIESDQLVYDYLSKVGDLAQQRQLPSGERMRLVSSLRNEIDRQRGKFESESPATVRRILGRLGTPDEQVAAATGGSAPDPAPFPVREEPRPRRIPRPRRMEKPEPEAPQAPAASPPHLAGTDELGPSGSEPDWWRIETAPFGAGDEVPGFVGGVEIPEILRPPRKAKERVEEEDEDEDEAEEEDGEEEFTEAEDDTPRRRFLRRGPRAPRARAPLANPLLLLAAALLVTGAIFGWLIALGAGWLLAYTSRRLTPAEAKWAALGLPGLVAAGGLTWLWGRTDGRWGTPIPEHGMGAALTDLWPVVLRVAAVASALYLVWRARRGMR
ncbi:hypothetical protein [Streptomyces sp. NBC_01465]|uniref:hypothetical protein n=1 Tax=Streptomyces sp. NBC_01465 TaxID=2903878 RepID=UPI002E2F84BC|nr:hypothetical protein [Streptomyces sp. NBC_01465]